MRRTRQVLAVVVVTTALCADQVASAAPPARPHASAAGGVGHFAGRLVSRLSQTFRQAVPPAAPVQARHPRPAAVPAPRPLPDQAVAVVEPPLSPFQFRLPPPNA